MLRSLRKAAALGLALAASALAGPAEAQGGIALIRDAEIEETMRAYTDPLLVAANIPPSDVKLYLVQDRSLNAFVTNGQNIFMHTGTIVEADTPNQLKGVIAHEIGHISGGHLARSREAISQATTPMLISIALGVLAIAAGAPDAGAALIAGSQQFGLASFVRFTQVQESAADQAGLTFLERSGQSPVGLQEFFEEFRYLEVVSESRAPAYFRTHPLSSDRIEALRQRIERSSTRNAQESPEDLRRFRLMQAKLIGYLESPARTLSIYPKSNTSEEARYARALAAYRASDLNSATVELEALMAAYPESPYYPELMGQLLFEHQRAEEALPFSRRAVELKPDNALLKIALARALLAADKERHADEAVSLLKDAVTVEPDNAFAWEIMADAHDARGEGALARLATAEAYFSVGLFGQAREFAERAKRDLPQNTVAWRRATDISDIAAIELRQRRGGPA